MKDDTPDHANQDEAKSTENKIRGRSKADETGAERLIAGIAEKQQRAVGCGAEDARQGVWVVRCRH